MPGHYAHLERDLETYLNIHASRGMLVAIRDLCRAKLQDVGDIPPTEWTWRQTPSGAYSCYVTEYRPGRFPRSRFVRLRDVPFEVRAQRPKRKKP